MGIGEGLIFFGFCLILAAVLIMSVRIYQVHPDFIRKVLRYAVIVSVAMAFSFLSLIIGYEISQRNTDQVASLRKSVVRIWGGYLQQSPPSFFYEEDVWQEYINKQTGKTEKEKKSLRRLLGFDKQRINIDVKKNIRTKGLVKFPGYNLEFKGQFVIRNRGKVARTFSFVFPLPQQAGNLTQVAVQSNGAVYKDDTNYADGIQWTGQLSPGEKKSFTIAYAAQGTESITYTLAQDGSKIDIKKFEFSLDTDYTNYKLPDNSMVPAVSESLDDATKLVWKADSLISGQNIALNFSVDGNYGPRIARLFLFSPLGIFLFLGTILIMSIARGAGLHPMHHMFLLAGYFVFYLLCSYLVTYLPLLAAVGASLIVSSGMMVYYARLIRAKGDLTAATAGAALLFQWIFAVAFFFPGHTGFIITLASITAFVFLMRLTADVEWENKW